MPHVVAQKICVRGLRWKLLCSWFQGGVRGGVIVAALLISAMLLAQESRVPTSNHLPAADMVTGEGQSSLSADAIISRLQQEPALLAAAKDAAAVRLSVDPSSISDAAIYEQIRSDPSLRAQITQEFSRQGYQFSAESDPDFTTPNSESATRSGRKTGAQRGAEYDARADSKLARTPDETRASSPAKAEWRGSEDENRTDPQIVRRPSPYPALPSLKDLYAQFPSSEVKLKRFGSDVFRLGTGNANDLPMDLPAGADYVLGPGDGLILNLWGSVSQRLPRTIDRQGQVALPEAGAITVAGLTIAQAQEMIRRALGEQLHNIRVEISLTRLRTVRVYVVGDVQRPGAYDLSSLSTPLNALYAAGGPTSSGSLRLVRHCRGKELVRELDLYDFLLRGVRGDLDRLLPGDTILVPPVGAQVAVSGMVRRPAIYELRGEQHLNEVLDLAGGVLVSAALHQINLERVDAHQRHSMVSIELPGDGTGDGARKTVASFPVQDGDRVLVSSILPYNEKAVYLEGHVFRPGKYPYRDGITVGELLGSYQDLLPEPAEHAEIVRLEAPDFRPKTITFNLSDVLVGDDPIMLAPFDVVRVFSRYEIDAPKVTVRGEVLRPGEYPLAREMTVAGLIAMAGGFKRSAYREEADLTSYLIENGEKIVADHHVIAIGKALAGEHSADVTLKPGDVLSVRQLTGWEDIGSSVALRGEVVYTGTYGISEGERLSTVLKRAGGFRPSAYPTGAVLERVQVREMGEKTRLEMIRQVETANPEFKAGMQPAQEQLTLLQAMEQQRQQILAALRNHPASGRLVIRISSDIGRWENTPADIEMRAGDVLTIPKRPSFVMVGGQVYNATAISYVRGKDARWYLRQAGGPTLTANRKGIFVLRADGSVVGCSDVFAGLWKGNVLSAHIQPGDSIVVPEKIAGGSMFWKNLMSGAQLASSAATVGLTAAYLTR